MSGSNGGRFIDLRRAWKHEAHNFTPWLADNLGRLGSELGIELELIKAEASLPTADDSFSADILARNVRTDENVLIENQLEGSDHTHLGQILTYLSGREAKTVVWVAPSFRDAHLAAINWLNDHTHEEFAFFAVRVRVVQIGDSPLAPLFEVLEKPNTWERKVQSEARAAKAMSELGLARNAFWEKFYERHPRYSTDGKPSGRSNQYRRCSGNLRVSYYLARDRVGVYICGDNRVPLDEVKERLSDIQQQLEVTLGAPPDFDESIGVFGKINKGDYRDESEFEALADWLDEELRLYEETLSNQFE